jgi:flavodoxin
MKAAVVYCSKTGNTKKVAQAIAEVLGVQAKSVEEKVELADRDLLCVGSGVHAGRPERGMRRFLQGLGKLEGKKGAVFGTYASQSRFLDTMESLLRQKGVDVIGKWGCKGKFLFFNRGRPNDRDLEEAREFAKMLKERMARAGS